MYISERNRGRLVVITGPMYSKKTARLIEDLDSAVIGGKITVSFKPDIDNRYGDKEEFERYVVSHTGAKFPTITIPIDKKGALSILKYVKAFDDYLSKIGRRVDVIGIDEIQFFDNEIVNVCRFLVADKREVIVSGLNLDFRGEPFGAMPFLLAYADNIIKLNAICRKCGHEATKTQRLINGKPANYNDPTVVIGADDKYVARCNECHVVPGKPKLVPEIDYKLSNIEKMFVSRFEKIIDKQIKKPKLI